MKLRRKPFFFISAFSTLSIAPVLIAVSCSENSTENPQVSRATASAPEVLALHVTSTSTADEVAWNVLDTNAQVKRYDYYFAAPRTAAEVAALPDEAWQSALPSKVSYDVASRALWARITFQQALKLPPQFVDLSASSGILDLKAVIDVASFDARTLAQKINLSYSSQRSSNKYFYNTQITTPQYTQVLFDLPDLLKTGLTFQELGTVLSDKLDPARLVEKKVRAYLGPIDATRFILKNAEAKSNVFPVQLVAPEKFYETPAPRELDYLKNYSVLVSASLHNDVQYADQGLVPSPVIASVRYLFCDYPSLEAAQAASASFTSDFPRQIAYDRNLRHVWAQIVPSEGYDIVNPYVEITDSMRVRDVPSLIDAGSQGYQTIDLSRALLKGSTQNLSVDTSALANLPNEAEIAFKFEGSRTYSTHGDEYLSSSELTAALLRIDNLTPSFFNSITAALIVRRDLAPYFRILDHRSATISLDRAFNFQRIISLASDASQAGELVNAFTVDAATIHNYDVKWKRQALPSFTDAKHISFLVGNYATEAAARAARPEAWSVSLPAALDYDASARHLWMKVEAIDGTIIRNPLVEITKSARVSAVKSLIDGPGQDRADLTKVLVVGNQEKFTINTALANIPRDATLMFRFNNQATIAASDTAQLQTQIQALNSYQALGETKVYLKPADETRFVIASTYEQKVTLDGLNDNNMAFTYLVDAPLTARYAIEARPDDTHTHNNVLFFERPLSSDYLEKIEYVSGYYKTAAAAREALSTRQAASAIRTVDYDPASRILWAYLVPKKGYTFRQDLIDVTNESKVQTIRSSVQANWGNFKFNLDQITIAFSFTEGALASTMHLTYALNTNGNYVRGVPQGTKLVWAINDANNQPLYAATPKTERFAFSESTLKFGEFGGFDTIEGIVRLELTKAILNYATEAQQLSYLQSRLANITVQLASTDTNLYVLGDFAQVRPTRIPVSFYRIPKS